MERRLIALVLVLLAGCSMYACAVQTPIVTKPFITCRLSDGKALLEKAVANQSATQGLGVGEELPEADVLCAPLKKTTP